MRGTLKLLYSSTILLSAFLLFQVQPLVAKCILPWFGGSPSIWSICIMFFQTVLLAGYLYAHLACTYLSKRAQAIAYILLMSVCLNTLNLLPNPPDAEAALVTSPSAEIIVILSFSVGLPYFIVSTVSPTIQAWYAETIPQSSPYRLYALSNLGSCLALLTYPTWFERKLNLIEQATAWSMAFYIVCGLLLICCVFIFFKQSSEDTSLSPSPVQYKIPKKLICLWGTLPFLTSSLLLAITNFICQDVAVIPFLWIAPLIIYLLSYIICFDRPELYFRRAFLFASLALGLFLLYAPSHNTLPALLVIPLTLVSFFSFCMLGHGELNRLKPKKEKLTLFYLMIAFGGALGGIFVSLIAPLIFNMYTELPITVLALSCIGVLLILNWNKSHFAQRAVLVSVSTIYLVFTVAAIFPSALYTSNEKVLLTHRNFFGVVQVVDKQFDSGGLPLRVFRHGRILHGMQALDEEHRKLPTAYYGPHSGFAATMRELRVTRPQMKLGVIGLGAGIMAAYGQKNDSIRFYEINPDVTRIANTFFSFISDSPSNLSVIHGDARMMLQKESSNQFDILVIDAFSGDAVPVHLLTEQAFELYQRHLKKDGVIFLNISNRHLDMRKPIAAYAAKVGMPLRFLKTTRPDFEDGLTISSVSAVLTQQEAFWNPDFYSRLKVENLADVTDYTLWTDDFSNIFEILK